MRGALLAILIFGAAPPAWAAKPAPAQESLQATRLARPVQGAAIVVPRDSCGTHWTGWVKEIGADVNPCPKGCERGKRLRLDEHKNSGVTEYQANYECYLPRLEVPQPALKPRAAGAPPRQNCGTMWTGWQSDSKSAVNPCPANCERGELRLVNRSLSNGKLTYDMNYQCYAKDSPAGAAQATVAGERRQIRAGAIAMQGRWPLRQASAVLTGYVRMRGRWPVQAAAGTALAAATIRMTGRWPLAADAAAFATGTVRMTGRWPAATAQGVVASQAIRMTGRWPLSSNATLIAASALRMTGRWPPAIADAVIGSDRIRMKGRWPVSAGPTKLTTGAIRMTGRSPP